MDIAVLGMRIDTSPVKLATRAVEAFGVSSKKSAALAGGLVKALGTLGVGVSAAAALNRASVAAGQFGTALAEVSTLIEGTPAQMQKLRQESIKLSNAYGGTATRNTKAFYQAISAGASTVEDAARIVDQANKLAVGGLSDVFTATDALTSVMNAYAESGLTAAQASDSMFVAVKAGKTTITELAGSLGRIAPFASAAGVSFDELNAAIAAVTAKGINTNEAVTGIRQALISVTKPTAQATELAGELGLNFNAAALEAQGLEKFMGSLARATGGSVEKLTELLGSAEAANAVLALLAGNGEKFGQALAMQAEKIGATDAAYETIAATFEKRMEVAMAKIENAGLGPGNLWLGLKVTVAEATADIVTDVQDMVGKVGKYIDGDWAKSWADAALYVDRSSVTIAGKLTTLAQVVAEKLGNAFGSFAETDSTGLIYADYMNRFGESMIRAQDIAYIEAMKIPQRIADGFIDAKMDMDNRIEAAVLGSAEKIKVGFEMGGSTIKLMNAEAEKTASELDAAAASADALASALGAAAGQAQKLSTYADGTAPRSGNAGDGYAGATSNWFNVGNTPSYTTNVFGGTGSKANFDLSAIEDQISTLRDLREEGSATSRSLREDSKGIAKALKSITSAIGEYNPENLRAALTGGADKPQFWDSFKSLAISSWQDVMSRSFEPGGAAMGAVTAGLADAMGKVLETNLGRVNQALNSIPETFDVMVKYGAGVDRYTFPVKKDSGVYNKFYNDAFGNLQVDELTDYGLKGTIGKNTRIKEFWAITTKKVQEEVTDGVNDILTGGADVLGGDFGIGNMPSTDIIKSGGVSIKSAGSARNVSFSTRDVTRRYNRVSEQLSKIVGGIAGDIRDTVRVFSDAIGGNSDRINKVLIRFKESTGTGKNAIQNAKDILVGGIEDYSEALAKAVLKGRGDLKMAGEKWSEALERLAKDFWGIVNTMEMLGGQMFKNNLNGAKYASKLVQQFGSVEDFATTATDFFSVAYSGDEQQAQLRNYAKDIFRSLGLDPKTLPQTREAYKNLVLSFNLEKKIGRERYSTLMGMAGLFDQILPAYDAATETVDKYAVKLNFATSKLTEMIAEADAAGRRFDMLASSLADTADIVRGMGQSSAVTFDILEGRFNTLYAQGMAGSADAMDQIRDVAKSYATAYGSRATSAADYAFITATIANKLDNLSGEAAAQAELSYYESESLQALKDSIANGEITNQLIREANDAAGGFGNKMIRALGAIYTAQTGKTLNLGATDSAKTKAMTGDDTSYKEGNTATNTTTTTKAANDNSDPGMNPVRKRLMQQQLRAMKRTARYSRRSMRVLEDFNVNGLPPERA